MEKAELGHEIACPGALPAAAHESDGRDASSCRDHVSAARDIFSLGVAILEAAVGQPAPTVHGRLMAAADGFVRKLGNALHRAPAHHQRDRRGMTLERVEKAP